MIDFTLVIMLSVTSTNHISYSVDSLILALVVFTFANKRIKGIICNSEKGASIQYIIVKPVDTFKNLDSR